MTRQVAALQHTDGHAAIAPHVTVQTAPTQVMSPPHDWRPEQVMEPWAASLPMAP